MPIDASIPLQVQPLKIPSASEVMSLRDLAVRSQINQATLEDRVRQQEEKNALLQLMKAPGAVDPATGRLTPQAIGQITQMSPKMGMELGHQQQTLALQDLKINENKDAVRRQYGMAYIQSYQDALERVGGNTQEAERIARQNTMTAIQSAEADGSLAARGLSKSDIEKLKMLPPVDQMRTIVSAMGGFKPESPLGKVEQDYRMGLLSTEDYKAQKAKLSHLDSERPFYQFLYGPKGEILAGSGRTGKVEPVGMESLKGPRGQQRVEEAKDIGQGLGKYTSTVMEDAAKASVSNRYLDNMVAAAQDFTPGKLTPIQSNLIQWAQAAGVPVSEEDKRSAGSIQALTSMAIKMAGTATRQADAQPSQLQYFKILESMPNEARTPEGFQKIVAYLRDTNNYSVFKHEQLTKWRQEHEGSAEGFEAQWPTMAKTLPLVWNQKQPTRAPKAALDYLKAHPETLEQFKAKYGYAP
jgi:hypothetical protein